MKLLTKIVLTIPSKIEIERALSLTRQTTSSKKAIAYFSSFMRF